MPTTETALPKEPAILRWDADGAAHFSWPGGDALVGWLQPMPGRAPIHALTLIVPNAEEGRQLMDMLLDLLSQRGLIEFVRVGAAR